MSQLAEMIEDTEGGKEARLDLDNHHGTVRGGSRKGRVGEAERETTCTDEGLLEHYKEGDTQAFTELVQRYERELYNYLRRYLRDAQLAEDVYQNTWLQVHLKLHLFEEGREFCPWLYAIATHQAVDSLRKVERHRAASLDVRPVVQNAEGEVDTFAGLIEGKEPEPSNALEAKEQREWVRNALNRLPPYLKTVVVLAYYQGLKYREIAEVVGAPIGTVKSRLRTAVLKLGEIQRMGVEKHSPVEVTSPRYHTPKKKMSVVATKNEGGEDSAQHMYDLYTLPIGLRLPMELHIQGRTYRQIADVCAITTSVVWERLCEARRLLKKGA